MMSLKFKVGKTALAWLAGGVIASMLALGGATASADKAIYGPDSRVAVRSAVGAPQCLAFAETSEALALLQCRGCCRYSAPRSNAYP